MSQIRFDLTHEPQLTSRLHSQKLPPSQKNYQAGTFPANKPIDHGFGLQSSLSIIIPAKNEALSLPHLVAEITLALRPLCTVSSNPTPRQLLRFEIIIVDDGSTDSTSLVLTELANTYPELRWLRLRATVGQSAAIIAGFRAARGDWFATLDADLQNDPADLSTLWNALSGYDVALGWRVRRADAWSKRLVSRLANQVRNLILRQSIHDTGCSLRIFPRDLALRLPLFQGVHRFFGPLFLREGCHVIQVPVNHRPRTYGRSHYNLWNRSLRVITDLIGVAWLLRRPLSYQVLSDNGEEQVRTHSREAGRYAGKAVTRGVSPIGQGHRKEAV